MQKIVTLILFLLLSLNSFSYSYQDDRKILLLNSYHPQYKWTKGLTDGITKGIEKYVPKENIFVEYLDGRRFIDDKEYIDKLRDFFYFKYSKSNLPAVIITTDDFAFQFILQYGEKLFPKIPVVFGGVNIYSDSMLKGKSHFTGVLEGFEFKNNLKLIEDFHPNLKELILLSDNSTIGTSLTNNALKELRTKKYKTTVLSGMPFNELQNLLRKRTKTSAALILAIHKDTNGRYFSYAKDLPILSRSSNIPIYGMWGVNNGLGTLGGYMTDAKTHAKEISSKVIDIILHPDLRNIPVQKNTQFIPKFDYEQLKRFNINLVNLPAKSFILNKPLNFYQQYKNEINILFMIFVFLIGIIIFLQHLVNKKTDELNETNKKLKEFVAIVVHDIRNPIGSIISLADLISEDPSDAKEIIPSIQRSANKSLKLVNDILQISAIESGKIQIVKEEMDVKELFDDIVKELDILAKSKGIKLFHNLESSIYIIADYYRLNQVLQNLISNSIKFCKEDGEIQIIADFKDNNVTISVSDNGIGMPKEMIKSLFNKTENVSRSGTAGESGTGYGLPLVYELVKLHDSELDCVSDEGVGTTFSFNLPTKSVA